ncbi:hypothetical protein BH24ACI2_BH24ACI2_15010 [soil metagenome]
MSPETKHFYEFGNFRLDYAEKVLLRDGKPVPLTPKVFDTLKILTENAGRLLEKDELMQKIWQDRFVEESNLTFNIKMLRRALGDNAAQPAFIETVPRRGYRFIAEVRETNNENALKNRTGRTLSQPTEKISADSSVFRKVLLPAFAVVIVGAIVTGFWYTGSKNLKFDAPVLSAPFSSEKLSTNGKVWLAVVSPNGKNVVYTNSNGGRNSVWLRQLESSNNVEIIPPSDDFYGGVAFSPDGDFLYFSRRPRNFDGQADIYRVSIFGGVPQKIIGETQGWISVSPDGGKISFVRCYYREDENCSLWIADATDGKNEKKLAARPRPFRIGDNKISPDGRTVAFAVGQSENQANEFGLVEVNIESGTERELTAQKFFNIKKLAWLPNRSGLLLTASRIPNKSFRIWQVSFVSGDAQPLTKDSETYSALSLDNEATKIISTQTKADFRLHLLNMENSSTGRVLADATTVAFAPNGRIIFSSAMSGNDEIWSINTDGSGQRQLTNDAADESSPIVSPDNNSIFFTSNRMGEAHIWRMNADGSNQTQITNKEGGFPLSVSPDGKWLYYHSGRQRMLWRVSAEGGKEQLVLNKRKYRFAVSPDGLQAAFFEKQGEENVLMIVSLADGQTVKTFRPVDEKAKLVQLAWTRDGKNLTYILANSKFENNTLWLQPLDEETPQQIADLRDEEISELSGFALSPDGKSFAVVQGGWKHDAVLLKGLK